MSWTAPRTWVTGEVPTASNFNTHVRDNLREMLWQWDYVDTSQTTASVAYVDLATVGPDVTLTTNTHAMVFIGGQVSNNTVSQHAIISYAVSGATTIAANDNRMYDSQTPSGGASIIVASGRMNQEEGTLTAGSNTFTAKYRVTGGTGTFLRRRMLVCAMGPA